MNAKSENLENKNTGNTKWHLAIAAVSLIVLVVVFFIVSKHSKPEKDADENDAMPQTDVRNHPSSTLDLYKNPNAVTVYSVSSDPRISFVESFLNDDEIKHLLLLARDRFNRSQGVSAGAKSSVRPERTSYSAYLNRGETDIVSTIEKRAADLAGVPVENVENLQIVRYTKGQFFKPHYDYFDKKAGVSFDENLARGGQRTHTVLVYLNTLPQGCGGATIFPKLKLKFLPLKAGDALFWDNVNPKTNQEDDMTFHGGQILKEKNVVKYAVNIWIRKNKFT